MVPLITSEIQGTIYEIKNMTSPDVTPQVMAFAQWAAQQEGYKFVLYLNYNEQGNLSQSFLSWARQNKVEIEYFTWNFPEP